MDKTVDDAAIYTYDAEGERIIKDVMSSGALFRTSGEQTNTWPQTLVISHAATIYPNGLLTLNVSIDDLGNGSLPRYTKHYYAGSQRIITKNGTSENIGAFNCNWLIIPFAGSTPPINPVNVTNTILQTATQATLAVMQQNSITPPPNYGQNAGYYGACVNDYAGDVEKEIYWFHPDHLGSSSYITGADGEVTQNIEYFPSGETFVENHRNSNHSPYKFNGKELDAETGYYYYGARYYNPRVSLWLNVDPLADYNPFYNGEHYIDGEHNGGIYNSGNLNPYQYCYQNPIKYVDPNGKQVNKIKEFESQAHNYKSFETDNFRLNPNTKTWYFDHTAHARNMTGKFLLGVGQQNSVMAGPVLEKVKNTRSVKLAQTELAKLLFKDGKLSNGETQGYWYDIGKIGGKNFWRITVNTVEDFLGAKPNLDTTFFQEENVLGSFWMTARVSGDGKNMIMSVFDTKTFGSLTDGLLKRDKSSKASRFMYIILGAYRLKIF